MKKEMHTGIMNAKACCPPQYVEIFMNCIQPVIDYAVKLEARLEHERKDHDRARAEWGKRWHEMVDQGVRLEEKIHKLETANRELVEGLSIIARGDVPGLTNLILNSGDWHSAFGSLQQFARALIAKHGGAS